MLNKKAIPNSYLMIAGVALGFVGSFLFWISWPIAFIVGISMRGVISLKKIGFFSLGIFIGGIPEWMAFCFSANIPGAPAWVHGLLQPATTAVLILIGAIVYVLTLYVKNKFHMSKAVL